MGITLAAEEVIESHAVDRIRAGKSRSRFRPDLQKVIEGVDLVRREAVEVVKAQSEFKLKQPPTIYSSTALTSEKKISMVGFDEVLIERFDLLTRKYSRRRVIVAEGRMGGIGKTIFVRIILIEEIGKTRLARNNFMGGIGKTTLARISFMERIGKTTLASMKELVRPPLLELF